MTKLAYRLRKQIILFYVFLSLVYQFPFYEAIIFLCLAFCFSFGSEARDLFISQMEWARGFGIQFLLRLLPVGQDWHWGSVCL